MTKRKDFVVIGPKLKYGGAGGALIVTATSGPAAKRKVLDTFKKHNPKVNKVSDLQSKPATKKLTQEVYYNRYGIYQTKRRK